ncbi:MULTISPECIES: hypothetical protein [Streptomyces]|uniref:Uncharacterized protein n=1 Tax=Streptomyces typhae TaxID=2681492 RepID=A0A6L6WSQ9_9ACTN|nr:MULTISPECIES: hypothetical protein [Streptomyces]MVO84568.1 hypothetical protein [Streptomyces typhae]
MQQFASGRQERSLKGWWTPQGHVNVDGLPRELQFKEVAPVVVDVSGYRTRLASDALVESSAARFR